MPIPLRRPFEIRRNQPLTADCFALELAPADGQPLFLFQAGQWVLLHLPNADGTTWRCAFSIANGTQPRTDSLELGLKISGEFTQHIRSCAVGDLVQVQGPYGIFTYQPGGSTLVCLAAGIGIVPLRSMILEALAVQPSRRIELLYTNKDGEHVPYREEFIALMNVHPQFHVRFFSTQVNAQDGDLPRRKSIDDLRSVLADSTNIHIVTCGPNAYMAEMKQACLALGVDVKRNFRQESFGS